MGLSPLMVKTVSKIIMDINRNEQVGIILVEQNAKMALKLANRAYVLETGNVVLSGDAKKLQQDERVKAAYLGE